MLSVILFCSKVLTSHQKYFDITKCIYFIPTIMITYEIDHKNNIKRYKQPRDFSKNVKSQISLTESGRADCLIKAEIELEAKF